MKNIVTNLKCVVKEISGIIEWNWKGAQSGLKSGTYTTSTMYSHYTNDKTNNTPWEVEMFLAI